MRRISIFAFLIVAALFGCEEVTRVELAPTDGPYSVAPTTSAEQRSFRSGSLSPSPFCVRATNSAGEVPGLPLIWTLLSPRGDTISTNADTTNPVGASCWRPVLGSVAGRYSVGVRLPSSTELAVGTVDLVPAGLRGPSAVWIGDTVSTESTLLDEDGRILEAPEHTPIMVSGPVAGIGAHRYRVTGTGTIALQFSVGAVTRSLSIPARGVVSVSTRSLDSIRTEGVAVFVFYGGVLDSARLDSTGAARLRLHGAAASGDAEILLVDDRTTPRILPSFATRNLSSPAGLNLRALLLPSQWIVRAGIYAGDTVPFSLLRYGEAGGNRGLLPSWFGGSIAVWAEDLRPIPVAFVNNRGNESWKDDWLPSDSLHWRQEFDVFEHTFGRSMFALVDTSQLPATGVAYDPNQSELYNLFRQKRGLIVQQTNPLYSASWGNGAGSCAIPCHPLVIRMNRASISDNRFQGVTRLLLHRILGLERTCAVSSVDFRPGAESQFCRIPLAGDSLARTNVPSRHDVAAFEILESLAVLLEGSFLSGTDLSLEAVRAGERQMYFGGAAMWQSLEGSRLKSSAYTLRASLHLPTTPQ